MFKMIHYCYLIYLTTFRICILEYVGLIMLIFSESGLAWQTAFKKTKLKLDLLTDIHMLLKVEQGIRSGICHVIYQNVKDNNKYIRDYD